MKWNVLINFLWIFPSVGFGQFSLNGTVKNEANKPLTGVVVALAETYLSAVTDANGRFEIKNIKQSEVLADFRLLGYVVQRKRVELTKTNSLEITLQTQTFLADEVVITATRADERSAMAYTSLDKKQIDEQNVGVDIPFLLSTQPGVVVNSDAGNGIGYTGIRVRGSDPTRINVTMNGIPMNDAESHGLFWVNMPDLASSLSSIQLQRGVGTSTNGAGAFGATLSMQSNSFNGKPHAQIRSGTGSFNTIRNTIEAGTGLVNGFTFDLRLSKLNSDGFIDRANSDLKSFFLSTAWYGKNSSARVNIFSGKEITYQAWYGVPQDSLATNRTYNPAGSYFDENGIERFYDNETDNYQQDHYQFFFNHQAGKNWMLNMALHYTRGRGYFEQFRKSDNLSDYGVEPLVFGGISTDSLQVPGDTIETSDLIRRRWLDNHFYGTVFSATWTPNSRFRLILGGGANRYQGAHFGEVVWAQYAEALPLGYRYYENDAVKTDVNFYAKGQYELISGLYAFADMQYRNVGYSFLGINNLLESVQQQVNLNFFNPKAGLTYELNHKNTFFLSYAVANREPVRDDFTIATPANSPLPEQLQDLEFGYKRKGRKTFVGATAYYMHYTNQLVLTGQVNDVGAYFRTNIPESYRAGLELEGAWKIKSFLEWSGNVALSRNKVIEFTEFVDDYDTFEQFAIEHRNTDISFSPNIVSSSTLTASFANEQVRLAWITRYVGNQFLDNTQSADRMLDAFFVNDFRVNLKPNLPKIPGFELIFVLNNIFEQQYAPNGYTFSGISGGERLNFNYLYPQAGRNWFLTCSITF